MWKFLFKAITLIAISKSNQVFEVNDNNIGLKSQPETQSKYFINTFY